jgi:carotenoid 1,2-hydratase
VDALSDDGDHGLTIIAMLGSVFSPYYAWARRRGNPDPLDHCALNVALYGKAGKRWTMTERGRKALRQAPGRLDIGPSHLTWDGTALTIDVDEITAPIPSRVRGRIRVIPTAVNAREFTLDPAGRHVWWPIAPISRVEVDLEKPALRWSGHAYLDSNRGEEPLEDAFQCWDWSRANTPSGTTMLYDVTARHGTGAGLALRFNAAGEVEEFPPPPRVRLPTTGIWRIKRGTQCEAGYQARVVETLEDTPFYARSLVETRLSGETATCVHESLSLDRFASRIVQLMLPFRMPRVSG